MAPAEKASFLGSQFDSKKCREQLVTTLSCFLQSRCKSLAFRTPVLLRLLLDLDTYGGGDPFIVFPQSLKMVAVIIATKTKHNFTWANPNGDRFRSVGGPLMKLTFPRVLHTPIRKTTVPYQ